LNRFYESGDAAAATPAEAAAEGAEAAEVAPGSSSRRRK